MNPKSDAYSGLTAMFGWGWDLPSNALWISSVVILPLIWLKSAQWLESPHFTLAAVSPSLKLQVAIIPLNIRILEFPAKSPVSGSINTLCTNTSLCRKDGFDKFETIFSLVIAFSSSDSKERVTWVLASVGYVVVSSVSLPVVANVITELSVVKPVMI